MIQIENFAPVCRAPGTGLPRLGVIALSTDLTFERDTARLIGWDEASVHVARINFENPTTPAQLAAMGPDIAGAAKLLVPGASLAAVAFACTSASVSIRNEVITGAIHDIRPGVPVITPSFAALSAMRHLGVARIALLTPYLCETTAPMVAYFEANGLAVTRAAGFGLADDRDMARLDPDTLAQAAISLDGPDVDAVFLSCTALPALDVIERIEAQLNKPVLGSNQATLWALRGLAGLGRPARPVGRLFDVAGPTGGICS